VTRQVVIIHGQEKSLSNIEFRLLRYLVERPGRVCSREELLDAVWGWDRLVSPREVDVYVARLRKIIEKRPANPQHILSVRGVGYRFEK
jgi:DNA-binding response OmpR family regulator